MRSHACISLAPGALVAGLAAAISAGCVPASADEPTGEIGMELQIAPGVTIDTVTWTISNPNSGFTRSAAVAVRFSNTVSFQAGGIPSGDGYTITLTAASTDGAFSCTGSAGFHVVAGSTTQVGLTLNCSSAAPGGGTVVVTGGTQICANLDAVSVSPLETAVGTPILLSATASAGSLTPSFQWTATAGSFDDPASATPTFTCPVTPGDVAITVTVSPGAPSCNTATSQTVTVTCDTLGATFTNVYATILGVRCTGCHRPGGGGVTVGMLDMSTLATAYANLVGVPARGTGAGASGVACAALSPPPGRVVPGDTEASLLFQKVHSKRIGANPPCGSPMPLPAAAPPLTQPEVDLIQAWIVAGAHND